MPLGQEGLIIPQSLFENAALTRTVQPKPNAWVESMNPYDGTVVGNTPTIEGEQIDTVVAAAKTAFQNWREHSAGDRSRLLRRYCDLLRSNRDGLAQLMTLEQGKPLKEAYGEVDYAASYVEWYAEEAKRAYGETIPSLSPASRIVVSPVPVGVCAAITPWNFPLAMITRKLAPALAAGCSMIIKPAPQTPLSAVVLGNLWKEVCDLDGLVQIVCGDAQEIGGALLGSSDVRKFSFTGSTAVGKKLYQEAAKTVKRVSLELGGNAPFIVLGDADLDAAIDGAMVAKYRNAGQTCVCVNRFIVVDDVYAEFRKRLIDASAALSTGPGLNDPDIGPLIDDMAVSKVSTLLEQARSEGGDIILAPTITGRVMSPAIVEAHPSMTIAHDEVFGPVSVLLRAKDAEEAIEIANSVNVGLAGYVYGSDLSRTLKTAERLEVGMVGVNSGLLSNAAAPFGGVKESGIGKEGGRQGLSEYIDEKYLSIGGF